MSFIRYQIGEVQQIILFDDTITDLNFLKKFFIDFTLPLEDGDILNPTVLVSKKSPKDIQLWKKSNYKNHKNVNIFSKFKNNKIYFYIQIDESNWKEFNWEKYTQNILLIFHAMLVSHILQNDVLRVHGMLLSNGDIIFGKSFSGKSTLAKRIWKNSVKAICDDGVLLDLKNNLVYPIPNMWDFNQLRKTYNFNQPYKLNRIILLKQDSQQKIKIIDKDQWKSIFEECSIMIIHFPFLTRGENYYDCYNEKWIECRKELEQIFWNRVKYIIQKYNNIEPLCITTNTDDLNKEFKILEE